MTATEPQAEDAPSLWRNRDFGLLWSSQTLSDLGANATMLALPLLVLSVTGSASDAGLAGTAYAAAQALLRLPGGALADRWNRRRVMLVSDAARVMLLAGLVATLATDHLSFPLILVVFTCVGVFDVAFSPAETASISHLVPSHQLPQAFAQNEARQYGAGLAGPPLGGLLFSVGRAVPFLFDLLTYAVSFCAIWAIRRPMDEPASERSSTPFLAQIAEGVRHVWNSRFLRATVVIAAPLNFAVTGALFATTVVLRQAGVSAGTIGLAQAVAAFGGLLGAFAATALSTRLSLRQIVLTVAWILVGCLAIATLLTGTLAMVVPLAVGLFFAPAANAALFGHLASTTPSQLQGRVISVVVFAATSTAALAPLAMGALVEHFAGYIALLACAVAVTVSATAATLAPGLRDTSDGAPASPKAK